MLSVRFLPDRLLTSASDAMTDVEVELAEAWVKHWGANKPTSQCIASNHTYVFDYRPLRNCCVLKLVINEATGEEVDAYREGMRLGLPVDEHPAENNDVGPYENL